jgi:Recombination endonuclease VII
MASKKAAGKALTAYFRNQKYGNGAHEHAETELKAQNNRCAICSALFSDKLIPNLDHDHETGKWRGMLCIMCNTGLGYFGDDTNKLRKAIEYLRQWY